MQRLRSCILSISVAMVLGALVIMAACTPIRVEEVATPSTQPEATPAPPTIIDFKTISVLIISGSKTISVSIPVTVLADGSLIGQPLGTQRTCAGACSPYAVYNTWPCWCNYAKRQ